MTSGSSQKIQTGMGALMTAIGAVGALAPKKLSASTGAAGLTDEGQYLTQLWTLREAGLGLMLLGTRKSTDRRVVLGVTVGLAVAEILLSLRSPALASRNRWSAAASAAVFGAAGAYALFADDRPQRAA